MSLADAFLRENLLQTVMLQDVYIARRSDGASRRSINGGSGIPIGSGIMEDPWDGSAQEFFDYIMKNWVRAGQTIHLGPTQTASGDQPFLTKGMVEWSPKSGMRIVGAGVGVTTLKRVQVTTNAAAVETSTDLDGFELSDLHIDCGFTGVDNEIAGAVNVKGKHVLIRRVKATNFGAYGTGTYGVINAAGDNSENCVIQDCLVQSPSVDANNNGKAQFYQFNSNAANSNPHLLCTIRNCAARGAGTSTSYDKYTAINPGYGVGTVLEGNQVLDCGTGIYEPSRTRDLVVWNNCIRNVGIGLRVVWGGTAETGRVIATDNVIELTTAYSGLTNPAGIDAIGTTGGSTRRQLIVKKNQVRDVSDPINIVSALRGIVFTQWDDAIIENNLLNNIDTINALRFSSVTSVKFFNNQNSTGSLLRGYNTSTQKYFLELEDAVQDVLLPV